MKISNLSIIVTSKLGKTLAQNKEHVLLVAIATEHPVVAAIPIRS